MAIQQHPLPQDISSYRFRLIGDMTIKQFASLGISIVLALIIYGLPLPFFFKYPLSFIFLCLGVGMAFVPVQGRSLDIWILAFVKSIYSPTQYSWKKSEETSTDTNMTSNGSTVQPQSNARIELNKGITYTSKAPTPSPVPATQPETISITTPTPPDKQNTVSEPEPTSITPVLTETTTPPTTEPTFEERTPESIKPAEEEKPNKVEIQETPAPTPPIVIPPQPEMTPPTQTTQLPIPFTPSTPNTLVGLTLTPDGKILEGVLVEIQKNGLTARATKSNKLGQFMFARPLENGVYQIMAEKESYAFVPYSLDLTGQIVRPLKIQAEK